MRLEFDSFEEIEDFLAWINKRTVPKRAEVSIVGDVTVAGAVDAHAAPEAATATAATTSTSTPADAWPYGNHPPVDTPLTPYEKPKRTRRTKTEIEAAKAAEASASAPQSEHEPAPAASVNPFASTQQAANAAMSEQPANNPTALATQAHAQQPAAAEIPVDAHAWLVAKAAELGPVTATQHLQAARNFIAKFQMAKYNDSFKLAELPSDVMRFSDVERAMHCAAMDYLSLHS